MNQEEMKSFILESFRNYAKIDPKEIPTLYFIKELQKNLKILEREAINQARVLGFDIASKIVSNIQVNLSGLSTNYEGHKEFLDELAQIVAPNFFEIWLSCEKVSEEYAINVIKEISIKIEH